MLNQRGFALLNGACRKHYWINYNTYSENIHGKLQSAMPHGVKEYGHPGYCCVHVIPMSVTVSLLCVCDSSPSSFSDSESCRDSLVLLRLPARRMEDKEPPFFTRKLRAPLIWSSREPPIRILRIGAGEEGSGKRSSKWLNDNSLTFCLKNKLIGKLSGALLHSPGFTPFTAVVPTTASFKADHVTAS